VKRIGIMQVTTRKVPAAPSDDERRRLTIEAFADATSARSRRARRAAHERVVMANLGVARSLAGRHRGKGIDQDDLEQVAYTALVLAVRRFDPARGDDFLSFAVPTITGELKRHFRDLGWFVRPPRRLQEVQLSVLSARVSLAGQLGRSPKCSEIAQHLGLPVSDVEEALALDGAFRPTSLDLPVEDGGGPAPSERLVHQDDHKPLEARLLLTPALARLPERDRLVVMLRFWEGLTQAEIGVRIGVTQTQVSRILARACDELRGTVGATAEASSKVTAHAAAS
jgi:RNA polymerase sigma-B factor